jgi:hypothetical protein
MKKSIYLSLFVVGLLVTAAASRLVSTPGYMDADYYYSGGVRLAQGKGLTEIILWNYLDAPQGLPHPSHTYWMPMASLLAAAGMQLGGINFRAAQMPFLLLAACLPPLTAGLAFALTHRRRQAILAGLLAVFPGYYLPYLFTTETFSLYMLGGTAILLLVFSKKPAGWPRFLLLGILAGWMHLSRADGLLWVGSAAVVVFFQGLAGEDGSWKWNWKALGWVGGVAAGYMLITAFWYARNLQVFHSLLPPGGSKTLWLTDYDQTFIFPADLLNFSHWWSAGWKTLVSIRLDALWGNLKTFVGVQGEVVLLPLALAGLWTLRKDRRVQFGAALWVGTLLFMTLVFPFAGQRGGFFHSGAAFQPLLWVLAAVGFDVFIAAGVRWRGWKVDRASRGFGVMLVAVLAVLTLALYAQLVIGTDAKQIQWQKPWQNYQTAEEMLLSSGAWPGSSVMVNNPPGYFAATGRQAFVIPNGDAATTLQAARTYAVDYLILENNHVRDLDPMYQEPGDTLGMKYLGSRGELRLYKISSSP